MRIAFANTSGHRVGGTESYVERVLGELHRRGHPVALLVESSTGVARPELSLPPGTPRWRVDEMGRDRALAALREWAPDLVYVQIIDDPALEGAVLEIAPAVRYAHAYYGTCISGLKAHRSPRPVPCHRVFGPACLALYLPRRCGGLNPLTMVELYRVQSARNALLGRYRRVLTASDHMLGEYFRNGVPADRLAKLPLPALGDVAEPVSERPAREELSLLFIGRMDPQKGGDLLLDALPMIQADLGRPVRAALAGDGPSRADWEKRARELTRGTPAIRVDFVGWVGEEERRGLLTGADLLVVPSTWPEPFGLVGPEAGALGVPAAAFAVGGIPEWLEDGVGGRLAPGDRPTARGLAHAVVECVRDAEVLARLRAGAREGAERFRLRAHVEGLIGHCEAVLAEEEADTTSTRG